jgi:hypothetical protein
VENCKYPHNRANKSLKIFFSKSSKRGTENVIFISEKETLFQFRAKICKNTNIPALKAIFTIFWSAAIHRRLVARPFFRDFLTLKNTKTSQPQKNKFFSASHI